VSDTVECKDLHTLLREIRVAAGLSQAQLAKRMGLSRGWVAHIERNIRTPFVVDVDAWARACDCRITVSLERVS
jgi:transcriptional regulator with XRE-family HTH domain